ncbi:PDR/VanB family oxidoreductase [Pantoea sp. Mb-10]|uniref:PDR/VanB family oxidoreductase n=1 Tax=unclassified Pantoea TaxID=2630326 RepID=UPI001E5B3FCE|nr:MULTISPECIES: PDR/VanB family oxidoreductase [unclassified Pantoea]MCE0491064.1 PDR/VanB family oxidoreductase [Pantoea sp. Mb-10]MCE0502553.1 PDR/VanB family oxidoreductase [Pantoea sp. Pb-8]
MSTEFDVVVDGIFRQGRHNLSVRLVAENFAPLPVWQPGAHIDVHLRAGLVRQYSLTGSNRDQQAYHICIARDAQSRGGSRYVHDTLRPGQRLKISPPRNLFPLVSAESVTLLAAGIGITPLYAMADALDAAGTPFVLHYFVKQRGDEAFLPELSRYMAQGQCKIWYSSEGNSPRSALPAAVLSHEPDRHLYVCGPAGFMQQVTQQALTYNWPAEAIHTEAFKPVQAAPILGEEGAFTVTLARSGRQCTVPAGQTIARVLQDNGIAVTLSCEMGMCGACLTRVTAGEIDHRDTVQSAAEKSGAEQHIALCCSRSKTPELVLDL